MCTPPAAHGTVLQGHIDQDSAQAADRVHRCVVEHLFDGVWQARTQVVSSTCPAIEPGRCVVSQVNFFHVGRRQMQASMQQDGWMTEYQAVTRTGPMQLVVDRRSDNISDDAGCQQVSRDCYELLATGEIITRSQVQVFEDGAYVGEYRTESVLHRLTPPRHPVFLCDRTNQSAASPPQAETTNQASREPAIFVNGVVRAANNP